MNSKQNKTLTAIFSQPPPKNLSWQDIESLLIGVGAKISSKGGSAITIRMGEYVEVIHRPHPKKEAKPYCIKRIRTLLDKCGVKAQSEIKHEELNEI